MGRQSLFYFSLFTGLIAFALAYCAITHFQIPLPRYYPTLNRWSMAEDPDLPSMRWYAQTVTSLLIGCVSGGVAYGVGWRYQLVADRVTLKVAGWMAIIAAFFMMLYIFQHEWRHWIVG